MFAKKVRLVFASALLISLFAWSNDGVFYASGNQLIPISETDISVKKEILTLNRIGDSVQVTVYYEFFNPAAEKEVLVGFEAQPPSVDFNFTTAKRFPGHPYMSDFKVVMNGESLPYEIAHVPLEYDNHGNQKEAGYYVDGMIKSASIQELGLEEWLANGDDDALEHPMYVYHFKARFRPGLNIIQHTYNYEMSYSQLPIFVMYFAADFQYVLTAANRWANNGIDDFTLNINMGDHTSFNLFPMFFKSADEWDIHGKGKYVIDAQPDANMEYTMKYLTKGQQGIHYHMQNGMLSFHKENFHPEGDLYINEIRFLSWEYPAWSRWEHPFDSSDTQNVMDCFRKEYFSLRLSDSNKETYRYESFTPNQRRILKNLPFAYRGNIFKDKTLQDFYESADWYIPNPDYEADMQTLTPHEQQWVEFWK